MFGVSGLRVDQDPAHVLVVFKCLSTVGMSDVEGGS